MSYNDRGIAPGPDGRNGSRALPPPLPIRLVRGRTIGERQIEKRSAFLALAAATTLTLDVAIAAAYGQPFVGRFSARVVESGKTERRAFVRCFDRTVAEGKNTVTSRFSVSSWRVRVGWLDALVKNAEPRRLAPAGTNTSKTHNCTATGRRDAPPAQQPLKKFLLHAVEIHRRCAA